jgi:hypothetical protein
MLFVVDSVVLLVLLTEVYSRKITPFLPVPPKNRIMKTPRSLGALLSAFIQYTDFQRFCMKDVVLKDSHICYFVQVPASIHNNITDKRTSGTDTICTKDT